MAGVRRPKKEPQSFALARDEKFQEIEMKIPGTNEEFPCPEKDCTGKVKRVKTSTDPTRPFLYFPSVETPPYECDTCRTRFYARELKK